MPLAVSISPDAVDQIREQVAFIARDSPANATAWDRRLRQAIREQGDRPFHAADHDAAARVGFDVFKLLFERTYYVHYTVDVAASLLVVINFRHGARLPRPGEP